MKIIIVLILILLINTNKKNLAQNFLAPEKKSSITKNYNDHLNHKLFPEKLKKQSSLMSKELLKHFLSSDDEEMIDSIVKLGNQYKSKRINTYNQNNKKIETIIKYWRNEAWKNSYRNLYEYDSYGNTTLVLTEHFDSVNWIPEHKVETSFDNNNRFLFFKDYYWESGWKLNYSETLEYSSGGKLIYAEIIEEETKYTETEFKYDSLDRVAEVIENKYYNNGSPHIKKKRTYEYNTEQYLKISTSYTWEKEDWINKYRYLKSYKANNTQIEIFERWKDSTWSFSSQETRTYDDSIQLIIYLEEDWDGSSWINNYLLTYEYDKAGSIISRISKRWIENNWFTLSNSQNTYNINGKLPFSTTINASSYDNITYKFKSEYEYDPNEKEIYNKHSVWENDILTDVETNIRSYDIEGRMFFERSSEWDLGYDESIWKTYTYYAGFSEKIIRDDQININNYSLLQNYPNPFNPSTTISFVIPKPTSIKINLFNILGEKITTIANSWFPEGYNLVRFNNSGLPSGTYIYRLETEDYVETKKTIILK